MKTNPTFDSGSIPSVVDLPVTKNNSPTSQTLYRGVVAAMVTPCKSPGVVDPVAAGKLSAKLAQHGCDGLFVVSSTGESVLLDEDDRRQLVAAVRKAMPATTLIYAGTSGLGLKQSIRYAENAAQDGANVIVAMAPFFLKFSQPELVDYFLKIADASPIPVALYHHPRMTTVIEIETVVQVAAHPNIVAIKDTSVNPERIRSLMTAVSGKSINVLQGNESLISESFRLGSHGMVTALANIVPEWHQDLYQAAKAQNDQEMQTHQERILKLWQMFRLEPVGVSLSAFAYSIKNALQRRGWLDSLHVMMPGFVPSDALKKELADFMSNITLPKS